MDATVEQWIASRPVPVQQRLKQFPPASRVVDGTQTLFVVGYTEEDDGGIGLWASPIDPRVDYDAALASKVHVCSECLPGLDAAMEDVPDGK